MKAHFELKSILQSIDTKGYKSYKELEGEYKFGEYTLYIDHVQGDPFASPSRMRVRVEQDVAEFPADTYMSRSREIALRDFITRNFHHAIIKHSKGKRGSGKSGLISIDNLGQEILERTSAFVNESCVEVRFTVGLPAFGRKVAGSQAEAIFFDELPHIIRDSLLFKNLDVEALYKHIKTSEDADFLRNELENLRLIAFVAEGSILPRQSGVNALPLEKDKAIPFLSPDNLKMDVELPNKGQITGMGIPRGITLIVGGGYHGKSTLLNAIELGIYNHIPGDGREFVVSNPNSVKIRAEDGRSVQNVDISPFISNLPFNTDSIRKHKKRRKDTVFFSTEDASGSTSQAANILEVVEVGADVLLIDEDTSATNFMIRDHRMQKLVSKENEPITPYIDKAKPLFREYMISSILVIGGSGDYFDIADFVIRMTNYRAEDVTLEAKEIVQHNSTGRTVESDGYFGTVRERIPLSQSLDASKGKRNIKISNRGIHTIIFGIHDIDLIALEQLVATSQTNAIGDAINYAKKYMDGKKSLRQITSLVMLDIGRAGLDVLDPRLSGDYAEFRKIELAAAINRLRTLKVEQKI